MKLVSLSRYRRHLINIHTYMQRVVSLLTHDVAYNAQRTDKGQAMSSRNT